MIKSAKHGGAHAIRVKTKDGEMTLTVPALEEPSADKRVAKPAARRRMLPGCGCLCTPESSANLLTTVRD